MMESMLKVAIRGSQLLWVLLITALIGNVIALNINGAGSAMAAINFTMFVAVVCWLAALYGLATAFVSALAIPIIIFALDGVALLFTFIDSIVLSAKLRAVNCGSLNRNDLPGNYIVWGSADDEKRCREIQASTVFMWFLFASFGVGAALSFMDFRRGGGGSVRSSRPSMAQVGA
ncbi:Non-classical export protein 2 [Colletotrichum sidae]|uniref:Non-classical export protein 2 n=4 Tax=Colletotrichum orbiculare species complex TaxID=2707354 RepID=A0A484G918_COLOR|nr:Non-classical export protein 2 [Colletotrichum orbiculare MAFF 240422]TDZ39888.1 Non-classical export protein 2 [Colletotrichum spinosum]TDZ67204.1 Non-classical export protein 2 [Colletotrichum trifolii]TEA21946.1 Non-classical export protein 2 [Colletotrichum sidae]